MKLPLVVFVASVLLVGCETTSTQLSPALQQAAVRQGETLRQAQAQAEKLEHGMTRDQVTALMGKPEDIAGTIAGADTPQGPWSAIRWRYYYWVGISPFITVHQLSMLYEQTGSEWRLNSWEWHSITSK